MDEEESLFHQLTELIVNQVSAAIIDQEGDDEVIIDSPQVSANTAINTYEMGM